MMLNGILTGILGNSAYEFIKLSTIKIFGPTGEELTDRLYPVFENASKEFFGRYGNQFGVPSSSFLASQENWERIIGSIHYSTEVLKPSQFNPQGFDDSPCVTEEALNYFLDSLKEEMRKDWFLDKILTEKNFMRETNMNQQQILTMLSSVIGSLESPKIQDLSAEPANLTLKQPNDVRIVESHLPQNTIPEPGKLYYAKYSNGFVLKYMVLGDTVSAETVFPDGKIAYYDVDFEGNVKNIKLPYPLEEYTVEVPEDLVLDEKAEKLSGGYTRITKVLKWRKSVEMILTPDLKLSNISINSGIHIDHQNKKFKVIALTNTNNI